MRPINHSELNKYGVFVPMAKALLEKHEIAMDYSMAMDAQPQLVTTSNAGIPAFLTNYLDPEVIEILFAPMKAVEIAGDEVKKGDWTTQTVMFPLIESTGEVSSYGDFNENGSVGLNVNWPDRQSYLYQTMTQWGELELDRAAEARINYAQEQNRSSALVLNKFQNNSYFYGISGLKNYGLLNDPSLPASVAPTTGAAGNTWALKTSLEIYSDVVALFQELVSQMQGIVERDAKMVLATSPSVEANLTKTNQYNVNVTDQIKKNFPNMRIVSAVQYATAGGNLVQLFAEEVDGKRTVQCAFNEKMRAHPVIVQASSYKQKKTGGSWGAIVRYPVAVSSMLGV